MRNKGSDIADSIVAEWRREKKMKELADRKKIKSNSKKDSMSEINYEYKKIY